jgi:hypothetical protein
MNEKLKLCKKKLTMVEGEDFHDVIQVVIIVDQEVLLVSTWQCDIQTDDGHLL